MRTIEISRNGDRTIAEQMAEMRLWLDSNGIRALRLDPSRILNGRVSFRAIFAAGNDADRFIAQFDDAAPAAPFRA
jgi:hypothetical protein